MKRYFKSFSLVAVLVASIGLIGLMPTVVSAEDTSEFRSDFDNQIINTENNDSDFEYDVWEDGVSITRYNGSGGNVEIPNMLGGKRVLAITGAHLTIVQI